MTRDLLRVPLTTDHFKCEPWAPSELTFESPREATAGHPGRRRPRRLPPGRGPCQHWGERHLYVFKNQQKTVFPMFLLSSKSRQRLSHGALRRDRLGWGSGDLAPQPSSGDRGRTAHSLIMPQVPALDSPGPRLGPAGRSTLVAQKRPKVVSWQVTRRMVCDLRGPHAGVGGEVAGPASGPRAVPITNQ